MEKLIEDLISRLESEKTQSLRTIENLSFDDKSLECIHTGKIFAFDYCIDKLQGLLEYQNKGVAKNQENLN